MKIAAVLITCLAGFVIAGPAAIKTEHESLAELRRRISSPISRLDDYELRKYGVASHRGNAVASIQPAVPKVDPVTYCYGVIGCLYTDDTWYDPINRAFNPEPMSREEINTRFILHTREKPIQDTMLYAEDLDTIRNSPFNPNRPTQFLVHGFVDDGTAKWMKRLTANLLDYGDYNVIIVNWGQGSLPVGHPLYVTATVNTRVVGLEIAYMVNQMITHFGVDPANVHLIGHSLGAHTVGYAGERIEGLGRITGLDPAEPNFKDMPTWVRLDPSDAQFVDAIHTDTKTILLLGYGILQPVGHLDFYVNGGRDQPGCDPVSIAIDSITEDMVTAGRELAACNHLRSIEFYIASLLPNGQWVGYECVDYDTFKLGQCASCGPSDLNCAQFGIESYRYPTRDRTMVQLYFDTGKDAPYLEFHYGIKISLAYPNNAEKHIWGEMKLSLYGSKTQLVNQAITSKSVKFTHGEDYYMLYISAEDVGQIQRISLYWNYDSTILNPGSVCGLFCNDHLYVTSVTITEMNSYPGSLLAQHTYKGCPLTGQYADIKDKGTADLYPTACA